jgi:hypothetical protein
MLSSVFELEARARHEHQNCGRNEPVWRLPVSGRGIGGFRSTWGAVAAETPTLRRWLRSAGTHC